MRNIAEGMERGKPEDHDNGVFRFGFSSHINSYHRPGKLFGSALTCGLPEKTV